MSKNSPDDPSARNWRGRRSEHRRDSPGGTSGGDPQGEGRSGGHRGDGGAAGNGKAHAGNRGSRGRPERRDEGRPTFRAGRGGREGNRGASGRGGRYDGRGGAGHRGAGRAGRGGSRRWEERGRGFRGAERGGPRDRHRRGPAGGGRRHRESAAPGREPVEQLPIPEDVTGDELAREVRQELRSLPRTLAEDVARHLVMVGRLLDEDPELAYRYSRVALRLASRVAAVREAAGFAAYGAEKYAEALAEFRAARRMTGGVHLWPVMADCERGLGRPERALAMAGAPEVNRLDKAGQVEMRLVAAGARRDMGQLEAALVTLKVPELASRSTQPWAARLRYAYADALLAVGRREEARRWFAKALEVDQAGATDASDRLAELDGLKFVDALDPHAEEADEEQPSSTRGGKQAASPEPPAGEPGAGEQTATAPGETGSRETSAGGPTGREADN